MGKLYRYHGKNLEGKLVTGTIEQGSSSEVADYLNQLGIFPLDIHEENRVLTTKTRISTGWANISRKIELMTTKVPIEKVQHFCFQLATLLEAGVPLIQSLNKFALTEKNLLLKEAIIDISDQLSSGTSLAVAFGRYPKIFPELVTPMIDIGENTGRLGQIFSYLALFFDRQILNRKRIRKAMNYPILVLIFAIAAIIGLSYFVIPKFSTMFLGLGVKLPVFTIWLLNFSNFLTKYIVYLIVGLIAVIAGIRYALKVPKVRKFKDKWILKMPIFGTIVLQSGIAQFSWILGLMLRSGVPLLTSLEITSGALTNHYIGAEMVEVRQAIERGESFSQKIAEKKIFTPIAEQILEIAEESQQIEVMLTNLGNIYDREIEYTTDNIGILIEPLLLVVIGGVVAIMILGIYFPMWEIIKAIK